MRARKAAFWAAGAGAAWTLVGYPLSLALLPRRPWRHAGDGDALPRVTVVVAAWCEFETLPAKLRSLERLDYPRALVDVVVVSDGDPELARVAAAVSRRATVLTLPERSGKAAALECALALARGEVVVMTDANNPLVPGALRAAVRHFADPDVHAVAGDPAEVGSAYDRYEGAIRRLESRSGSVAGMSGGLLAVRRDRLPDFPRGVLMEDLWLLCQLVRAGGRVVYEPAFSSTEPTLPPSLELERRARIAAGRVALLGELRTLPPGFVWRLGSHKVGRLALPALLATIFLTSLGLRRERLYAVLCGSQLGLILLAALSAAGAAPRPVARPARALEQFAVGNAAVAVGVARGVRRSQDPRWKAVH